MNEQAIADYVLGESTPEERATFELELERDMNLRERVRRLEAVSGSLADMSLVAWQVALDGPESEPAPVAGRPRRSWGMRLPRVAIAGLAALALFVIGIGTGALISRTGAVAPRPGARVALSPLAGGPAGVSGDAYLNGESRMVLVIHRLPQTSPGRYYEAWLMTSIHQLRADRRLPGQLPNGRARLGPPAPGRREQLPLRRHLASERRCRRGAFGSLRPTRTDELIRWVDPLDSRHPRAPWRNVRA